MFAPSFHAWRRHGPHPCCEIDLRLLRQQDLRRSRRGQDREFEGARRRSLDIAQPLHEVWHVSVGQGGVMFNRCDAGAGR